MRAFVRNIFILLNIVVAICLLFSYTAVYINPVKFWIPVFFGLAYPYILLANILFVLFWLIFHAKYSFISVICILVGFNFMGRFFQFSGKKAEGETIKICSYNVKYFQGDNSNSQKVNAQKVIDFLEDEKFDIICLQEANIRRKGVFDLYWVKNKLSNINHLQLAHTSRSGGPVTYSKYPIIKLGEMRFKNTGNLIIYSDIVINNDTVRVYNCHLQSYKIKPNELSSLDSISFNNNQNYDEVKTIGAKMKQAFLKRAEQAVELHEHISKSPYPAVVCGDFNDTPVSYSYRKVKGKLKDAFVESGQGLGSTYNGKLPSFRIDYILHDKVFESFEFEVGQHKYSDHFPVMCKLTIGD